MQSTRRGKARRQPLMVIWLIFIVLASASSSNSSTRSSTSTASSRNTLTAEPKLARADADLISWGIRRINASKVWNDTQGKSIKIAILDTGIDWTHPDLAGAVAGGICIICNSSKSSPSSWLDHAGHGTAVAGVISAQRNGFGLLGAAYGAALYAVKVLNDSGIGFESDVAAGIDWSVESGMNIVVMSFSSPDYAQAEANAVQNAYSKGLLLIASAGNAGPANETVEYPATFPSVIAVGATDYNNQVPSWSSRGPQVDLSAPGVGINTTWIDDGYASLSGTSMAAPYVAASAALVWSARRNLTNLEVRSILEQTAHPLDPSERSTETGFGLVDSLRAVNLALGRRLDFQPLILTLAVDNTRLTPGTLLTALILVLDADGEPIAGLSLSTSIINSGRTYWSDSVQTEVNGWVILHILLNPGSPMESIS